MLETVLFDVLMFSAKTLVIVAAIAAVILLIALLAAKAGQKSELEVEPLHKKYKDLAFFLKSFTSTKEDMKALQKEEKKKAKEDKKREKSAEAPKKKTVFVLNFDGDIQASQVENLREEITAVLQSATSQDEVVVRVESPGGVVHGYGLAAAQLIRLKEHKIPLTICVDAVAASGGYMMACVADKLYAAPFAILGSIGVVAQVPNFHRVLKKYDVDYKEYTAGDYKRTVSLLGEITPKGEEKFQERLVDTHVLFKAFVQKFRPQVDVNKVATGEYWFGEEALKLGLVDALKTSDEYLLSFDKDTPIFELSHRSKKSLADKISEIASQSLSQVLVRIWNRLETQKF